VRIEIEMIMLICMLIDFHSQKKIYKLQLFSRFSINCAANRLVKAKVLMRAHRERNVFKNIPVLMRSKCPIFAAQFRLI
jgi:hypothetical protein